MFQKENILLNIVIIYVWHDKAYIPIQAQYESGIFMGIEPIYITAINAEDLVQAVQAVKNAGHKRLSDPKTREEFQRHKDPVLKSTKARNWKQLARNGASYTIGWTKNEIRIDMSRLDEKGRWEYDPEKVHFLPPDTSLGVIVEIILEDIKTRPELTKLNL